MTNAIFANSIKHGSSFTNAIKHTSSIVKSFLLRENGGKILRQDNGGLLLENRSPSGSGWTNSPKS